MTRSCRIALALFTVLITPAPVHAAVDPTVVRREILGHSIDGRPIRVVELGDPDEMRKLLVVGCIHGNEPAGIAVAHRLAHERPPTTADLWIIENLNPDGVAANTRQNAHGVDLNRNFPWHWQPLGRRGSLHYAGTHALSEPESRLAYDLILRLRPTISIWFHQALGVVDESGGSVSVERKFARAVGLPLVRLPRYPGSVASWENHAIPHSTAFVVELRAGSLSAPQSARFAHAVLLLAGRS